MSLRCGRSGCGVTYEEDKNHEDACVYHAGSAVFHEGLKGWSCCKKRVIDFDEFMQIPGCASGKHVPAPTPSTNPTPAPAKTTTPAPVQAQPQPQHQSSNPEVEVYRSAPVVSVPKPVEPSKSEKIEVENDPADAVIAPGTLCKRTGCSAKYVDEGTRSEPCIHHPGHPLFHEGSKGYTCCKMVGDFDQFLNMPGCATGKHKFTEKPKSSATVECRHDWYQMGNNVVMSIYAKGAVKDKTSIRFEERSADVEITMKDGQVYKKCFKLSGSIQPEKSTYEVLSTKVEIKLAKAGGAQWQNLES